MARNRKNNHYHYAEKFADIRRKRQQLFLPKKTVIVAALLLLIFGIITTTFSAYVNDSGINQSGENSSILVNLRNTKAQRDIALTGAEADLAATGWNVTSGAIVYFDATGWDFDGDTNVQILIGHSNYSVGYLMTKISGSNLYYISMPSWSGFTEFCFTSCGSDAWPAWNQSGDSPSSRKGGAKCYTDVWTADRTLGTTNKYMFKKASADDNASITMTENSSYSTLLNSTFKLYSATKKNNGSYGNSVDGGTATMSGTTKSNTNATSTSTFSTSTSSANPATNYPLVGTAVSLSTGYTSGNANADSNANKGYKFDGYAFDGYVGATGATSTGTPINMTSIGGQTTTVYACFSEVMHNITVKTNIPGDSSTTTNSCVGIATSKSLSAPAKTGYTFTGWSAMPTGVSFSSGSTSTNSITIKYSSTATSAQTITLTANYRINPPTAVSIDDKTTTVGTSVSLNPSVTIAADGATAVNSYTVSPSSGASVNSSGVFSATKPGVYTVTLSSQARKAASGGVAALTSTAVTDTATVTVLPVAPQWTLTMSGYDPSGDLGNGHTYGFDAENPYLVTLGSDFSFTASINSPPNDSNYVYTWYNADDEVLGSVASTGSSSTTKITFGQANASEATTSDVVVPVKLKVTYTGTDANVIYADGDTITVYYYIKSLINSFKIPELQKIYNNPNDAKMDIEYNITNGSGYTTTLYASSDNVNFYEAISAAGFLGTQIGTSEIYELDPSANDGPMSKDGPKYFYVNMGKSGVNAKTDIVHTTVGADNADGTRQIYFINNTGLNLSDYRVMAFFVDGDGQSYYQTAQDVYKGINGKPQNNRFRVTIPDSATQISFGIAKKSKYAVPEYDSDDENFDYTMGNTETGKDNTFFIAYMPAVTELDADHNTINASGKTLVSGYSDTGSEPNPFYTLTTSYVSYVSVD